MATSSSGIPNSSSKTLVEEYLKEMKDRLSSFENTRVRIGIIGNSGTGKSSLINAILGEDVANVGIVETTRAEHEHHYRGMIFVDLPGCGTPEFPIDTYVSRLNLAKYDSFIIATANRFTENEVILFHKLKEINKPCLFVRTKFDLDIDNYVHDNKLRHQVHQAIDQIQDDVKSHIMQDIRRNFEKTNISERVYFISSRYPSKYDLSSLLRDIQKTLSDLKKKRFIADMSAYSQDALEKKNELIDELIPIYASLSAANGLNPIPGLDIAVDVGILVKLGFEVAGIYGINEEGIKYATELLNPKFIEKLWPRINEFSRKYLTNQGVLMLLSNVGGKIAVKWIPFVGPLIAAGIGWQSTFWIADELQNTAEKIAEDMMKLMVDSDQDRLFKSFDY